jgi:hypothetical protein
MFRASKKIEPDLNIFKSAEAMPDGQKAGVIEINTLILAPGQASESDHQIENFDLEDLELRREQTEEEKPAILCCKIWLLKAFIGGIFMGIGTYFFAVYQSSRGVFAASITGPFPAIVLIIWKL